MHRQSFYYHFRDKYELVNWIFNEEFLSFMKKNPHYNTRWSFFNEICQYFYDNRDFYRKVLMVEEQNSFSEYFSNFLQNIFYQYLKIVLEENEDLDFYIHFYTDAIISAVKRWISSENCYQPEKFISLIRSCLTVSSITLHPAPSPLRVLFHLMESSCITQLRETHPAVPPIHDSIKRVQFFQKKDPVLFSYLS